MKKRVTFAVGRAAYRRTALATDDPKARFSAVMALFAAKKLYTRHGVRVTDRRVAFLIARRTAGQKPPTGKRAA